MQHGRDDDASHDRQPGLAATDPAGTESASAHDVPDPAPQDTTAQDPAPHDLAPHDLAPHDLAPHDPDGFFADIGARAFRFAEAGLRQRDDALDAVQDAMLKMLSYRERPASEWPPLFWSILRSRIVDIQRRRNFRLRWLLPQSDRDEDVAIDWADGAPGPGRAHDNQEGYARLVQRLRALPARQREAFTLRVLEEFDVAATARIMGCSEGSVKTHLFRAREALQKHLEDWQ